MKFFSVLVFICVGIGALLYSLRPMPPPTPESVSEVIPLVQITPAKKKAKPAETPGSKTPFELRTEAILESLPTMELVNSQPGKEFHHAPQELIDAAKPLGEVISAMKADSKLVSSGKRFFKKCALKEGVLEQVRALCLRDLKDWSDATNDSVSMTEFPTRLVRLAAFLPATKY